MHPAHIIMVGVAAVAAYTDTRTGKIPNWLTFPAMAAAPLVWLLTASPDSAVNAVMAVALCGIGPYFLFRMNALGGGDVKLFAALGGYGGMLMGLEIIAYSMIAAMLFVFAALGARRQLGAVMGNVGRMVANPFLPKQRRHRPVQKEMHTIRLGAAILAGTAFALYQHYALAGGV